MTLKECYNAMDGNYEDVLARFRSEDRIEKYALKFLSDQSFTALQNALAEKDMEEAFRAAHTLKGVSQNLGFSQLAKSANLMTETLRGGNLTEAEVLLEKVAKDYSLTVDAISQL